MERKAIILNPKDNVATAISDLEAGNVVEMEMDKNTISVKLVNAIPFGHKFSLSHIKSDSPVMKYGEVIGMATSDIQPGQHVHVHNVASARARGDLAQEVK
ncbi:MAG: UxaA family hydrolase [Dehalococcoidia bacterium]|nr:UxaA family hydrolase [Dehalococcoidia bacterium]